MMNKLLCNAPYTNMFIDQRNNIFPCCVFNKNKFGSRKYTLIDEYLKSQELLDIKNKLDSGIWPEGCRICEYRENNGLKSDAAYYKNELNDDNLQLDQINNPIYLDIRPGNDCNLKCRMCFPLASNLINEEVKKFSELQKWHSLSDNSNFDVDQILKFIKNNNIHILKILGGEPTVDKKIHELLDKIDKSDNIKSLRFTTNGTNLNKKFRSFFSNFDEVKIHFSLDAVSDTYNYIRTNSNFKKVEKNICKTMTELPSNKYTFNIVLTPYNIFNLKDLILWFYKLENKGFSFRVEFINSVADYTHNSAVKDFHRESVINEIETIKSKYNSKLDIDSLLIQLKNVKFNEENFKKFKEYNNTLDNIRKTSLLELDKRFEIYI